MKKSSRKKRFKVSRRFAPLKVCNLCTENIQYIDYKDVQYLFRFISDYCNIKPRSISGNCIKHQNMVADAIVLSREMCLLSYIVV